MEKIVKSSRLILTLVLLALSPLAFLAGTDIYHASEPNLSSEWFIFSTYFYLSILHVVVNLIEFMSKKNPPRHKK